MFFALDTSTQLFLFTTVALASFFLANAMDGVLGPDGFGVIGNQVIIIAGFYLGIWFGRHYGFFSTNIKIAVICGLTGAFVTMCLLCILKALLNRL